MYGQSQYIETEKSILRRKINMKSVFRVKLKNFIQKSKIWLEPMSKEFNEREFARGKTKPVERIDYKISRGKIFTDVLGDTWSSPIFHKNVIGILSEHVITGLEYYPIRIRLTKIGNNYNDEYYLVRSSNQCGEIDTSSSEIIPSSVNPEFKDYKGYKLDTSKLDSNIGFFSPVNSGVLHCSEAVRKIFLDSKEEITGIKFEDISDFLLPLD